MRTTLPPRRVRVLRLPFYTTEAQHEIPNEEEAYDEYAWYDGSTTTMESCDDEELEERMSGPEDEATYEDEVTYEEEFTNYTYERAVSY